MTNQGRMAGTTGNRKSAVPRGNLAEQIALKLRQTLASGELAPGDKLPTEKELSQTHGVSRAVVREAIAALRSEGLIIARQGSGAYVAEQPADPVRQGSLLFEPNKLSSVIEVLEIRAAAESEAAALAAERATPAEVAGIRECHQAFADAIAKGGLAEEQDVAFHRAIMEATHNRQFVEFFQFLGSRTIPRAQARQRVVMDSAAASFLTRVHQEHDDIVRAIVDGEPDKARAAMTVHLKGSQERYSRLAESRIGQAGP